MEGPRIKKQALVWETKGKRKKGNQENLSTAGMESEDS